MTHEELERIRKDAENGVVPSAAEVEVLANLVRNLRLTQLNLLSRLRDALGD